jgi:hypothetical protein
MGLSPLSKVTQLGSDPGVLDPALDHEPRKENVLRSSEGDHTSLAWATILTSLHWVVCL